MYRHHDFRLVFLAICKKASKNQSIFWLFQLPRMRSAWLQMLTPASTLTGKQELENDARGTNFTEGFGCPSPF